MPDGTGRYWRGLLANGSTLDLFLTTPERWGATLLVRTGSWDFSREIVTRARTNKRYRFGKGGLCHWFEDKQEAFADLVPTPVCKSIVFPLSLKKREPLVRRLC